MITAEKLVKYYDDRAVVREMSFNVEKGEIVGLLGPNGAGKTTTMRMLTGYVPADGGRAVVAGYDVADRPMEVRKRLGYLPETVPLYTEMPVKDYLDFIAKIRGVPGKGRKRRVEEVMELCRVADVSNRIIGKLSRGYRQRVGLAQAIIHNPQVIILDEPTVGLDPRQIIEIRKVIRDLAGNHSMILSTHILPEVSALCDRVVIVNRGRVLVEDTLANLQRRGSQAERLRVEIRGPHDNVRSLLQEWPGVLQLDIPASSATTMAQADAEEAIAAAEATNLETGEEVTTNLAPIHNAAPDDPNGIHSFDLKIDTGSDVREALAGAIINRGWGLLELKTVAPSLEEIFVQLITEDLNQLEQEDEVRAGGYAETSTDLTKKSFAGVRRVADDDEMEELATDTNEAQETETLPVRKVSSDNKKKVKPLVASGTAPESGKKRKAAPSFLNESDNTDGDELDRPADKTTLVSDKSDKE